MGVRFLGRYVLVSAAPTVAAMASALAAELAVVPAPGPDIWWAHPPPLRFSWTGCHLGGHFGGAFIDDVVQPAAGPPVFFTQSQGIPFVPLNNGSFGVSESGVLGGAQAGCDLQVTRNWVMGIDADVSGTTVSGTNGPVSSTGYFSANTNVISTVTGRLGYTVDRGEGLIYAKAGAAFVNNRYSFNGAITVPTNSSFTSSFNFSDSETRAGWTVGTGVEWAILNNWSVKLEYDFLDFGSHNTLFTGSVPVGLNMSVDQHISEVKLGVNYLFGWQ